MLLTLSVSRQDAASWHPGCGFLRCDAFSTGIGVYAYTLPDGTVVYELRSIDEVMKAESLATMSNVALTAYQHPGEFVDPSNWQRYMVGLFGEKQQVDQRRIKVQLIVFDGEIIRQILSGELTEISMGYYCQLVSNIGTFDGQAHSLEQTNIVYNHGTILRPGDGRLGSGIAVQMDGKSWRYHAPIMDSKDGKIWTPRNAGASGSAENKDSKTPEVITLVKIKIGDKEYDIPDEHVPAGMKEAADSLTNERDSLNGQVQTAAALQSQQDSQKQDEKIRQMADARTKLIDAAKPMLRADYDYLNTSNRQIMIDSLKTTPAWTADLEKATDATLEGSFFTAARMNGKQTQQADSHGTRLIRQLNQQTQQQGDSNNAGSSGAASAYVNGAYVPVDKRGDSQIGDASDELAALNAHQDQKRLDAHRNRKPMFA